MPRSTLSRSLTCLALVLGIALCASTAEANNANRLDQFKKKAVEAENRGAWLDACRFYDELVRKSSGSTREKHREAYQRCLRRLQLFARHSDSSYRQTVKNIKSTADALKTYQKVLELLNAAYHDRSRAELGQLFQQGVNEVRIALDDSVFKRHYLGDVKPGALSTFKSRLETWPARKFSTASEAGDQVRLIIGQAVKDGLPGGALMNALVMEFAAGACNALDEYSSFLTPTHLAMIQSPPRSKLGGLGFSLDVNAKVSHVWPLSPALDKLQAGDRLLRVGKRDVTAMTAEEIAAKFLRGKIDESVEIEFERLNSEKEAEKQTVKLKYQEVSLPAVEHSLLSESPTLGYLRINYFTEDTLRDVKDALVALNDQGSLKGLTLDLRGNPGGAFHAAVSVAELFLATGVISVGQSNHPNFNRTFKVEAPGILHQIPMVVLVDADTASAAEVLAAALKESRTSAPTKLMGQTTFGKGSVQCLIELKKVPLDKTAGIRLTVAKLFSPSSVPISGKGITPDFPLPETGAIETAKTRLEELLKMDGLPMPKSMGPGGDSLVRQ